MTEDRDADVVVKPDEVDESAPVRKDDDSPITPDPGDDPESPKNDPIEDE